MITKVKATNFLSFSDLDVTLPKGVTLIDGWNADDQTSEGSGKSAVLNAICWGLYGKIPKEANVDDVIKEGEKLCAVSVWFSNQAAVLRSRNPNTLELHVFDESGNGRIVKGKDARETQTLIEEFVGLTFETFCQTVYFAQNYTKKFITSNQEEKGKILSEVQNLSVFDKAGKEVRSLIKLAEESLVKLKHNKELAAKDEELTLRDISAEEMKQTLALQQQTQRIQDLNNQILSQEMLRKSAQDQQAQRVNGLNAQVVEAEQVIAGYEVTKAQHLEAVSN